ncbi:unnamed protein product [Oncorhynchus mykiss]|uniref:Uncharacterized protein n=1 Tax=Oncorhynchus mykiss TaxID=8022 RepID=A0A060W4L3_ONCMY|nr:unnamed protein product [Oncorhynchus mykiss]
MHFKVRAAAKEDCKDISRMIMELAVYENMPDQVKTSHEDLERDGFSPNPFYECLIAEVPDEHKTKDGKKSAFQCSLMPVHVKMYCACMEAHVHIKFDQIAVPNH